MVKKQKKGKSNTPDPSLLVVEPTIQYMSSEVDNEKIANMGKKADRK